MKIRRNPIHRTAPMPTVEIDDGTFVPPAEDRYMTQEELESLSPEEYSYYVAYGEFDN